MSYIYRKLMLETHDNFINNHAKAVIFFGADMCGHVPAHDAAVPRSWLLVIPVLAFPTSKSVQSNQNQSI